MITPSKKKFVVRNNNTPYDNESEKVHNTITSPLHHAQLTTTGTDSYDAIKINLASVVFPWGF